MLDSAKPARGPALAQRIREWFEADRKRRYWALVLFVAALAVRLHWNLSVHPLSSYIYSDMKGYWGRADALLDHPFSTREYDAFFPFGTTWMVAAIKVLFGRENFVAISIIYALFGASIVAAVYVITDRVLARFGDTVRWVAPAAGLFLVVYYPLIAVGGYVLSDLPFSFCLTMGVLLLMRLVDEGRPWQAWLLGLLLGFGTLIRPQMLLHVALIGLFWLGVRVLAKRRRTENPYHKLGWAHIGRIAVPLLLLVGVGAVRFHVHTGRYGLVSENSSINLIFGRCHNKGIYSRTDGQGHGTIRFSPPPLIQFEAHSEASPDTWFKTKSVWGDHPEPVEGIPGFAVDAYGCTKRPCRQPGSEIEYRGYIGDRAIHKKIVLACLERSGVSRQAYFTLTHWMMLWRFNLMWPDQANPRPRSVDPAEGWRHRQEVWARVHRGLLMVPALLGLGFALFPLRRPRHALVALNFWALMVIAGVWLGGIRFRIPYDPIIVILASLAYAELWLRLRPRLPASLRRRLPGGESGSESESESESGPGSESGPAPGAQP